MMEGMVNLIEKLCDVMETMRGFSYLGNKLNASGGCEVTVKAKVRISLLRFLWRGVTWN